MFRSAETLARHGRFDPKRKELDRLGIDRVPSGWTLSTVGSACAIRNELRLPISVEERNEIPGPYPYYGPTGHLSSIDHFRINGEFALIGEDGDHFMEPFTKNQTLLIRGKFNVNNHAHVIGSGAMCSVKWFFYFYHHRDISHSLTRQGAGRFKLTKAALEQLPILLPPLPEQEKIAEILRTWDEAVEKLEALRTVKTQQFEGVAACLINTAVAEPQHLREHLSEVSERNRGKCVDRILSVTNSAGFVLAEDQFAYRVASADISNYKIVRQGQYAYNPSRINVGSIARLDDWAEGALSPMYVVFEVRDTLDADYFGHWLRSGEARKRIALAAQGSVRDTVSFGDLSSILIPLPSLNEQQRIARTLSTLKDELTLLDREIKAITRQKRGLMQKLLTGEWRVNELEAAA